MSVKNHVLREFDMRVFEESYSRIYKCLQFLDEEQLWKSPNDQIAPVGCLILHLCGNARQWMLSGLGGANDNRDRDQEFVPQDNISKGDFIFLLENMKSQLKRCMDGLSEEDFNNVYSIQGFQVTGFSTIIHVIEHFSYHTGQITTLTKLHTGEDTGFYTDYNLNKHNQKL
ncbi:MAG: DinB family protein [Crocinitomicaceae bacterium]|mgnify:CR=1 FL=1|jgi:uncharacterized damage-inducible protein DinB|nr:DinB family protein [Crocinitomicaceae bacterium]MDG1659008.1 DinB family protein [Crocinitomicaceae bacterium]